MGALCVHSTKKELDFLQLRQQLKQRIRNTHAKEVVVSVCDGSIDKKNKLPCDNFGSFFGPPQHSIAQRLIEECKSLMPELKVLASRVLKYSQDKDDVEIPKASKEEPVLGKDSASKPSEERNPGSGLGIQRGSVTGRDLKTVRKQNVEEKERLVHGKRHPMPKKHSCVMKEKERRRKRFREEEEEDDDFVMVSTFDDILREERKSEKIARKEDEKERLLIQQEEKQARLRKANLKKLRASKI
ncbi:uncharacterized protein Pyn_19554 [Prunus yedoensis var. nudiflora]|uniref:Uncharacterized protein n=1 Tax=Prunus yedoensis var. nudiflora TaxID=2094558 RepID=A0A314XW34_PRUYE|nr:uncharacterized protein Pyn_19554 [Prunus yedoensis var. nudiflora]